MVSWRSPGLTGLAVGCELERMRRRRGEVGFKRGGRGSGVGVGVVNGDCATKGEGAARV